MMCGSYQNADLNPVGPLDPRLCTSNQFPDETDAIGPWTPLLSSKDLIILGSRRKRKGRLVQDGREEQALISSCKSTKITTSCRNHHQIGGRWNPSNKVFPSPKTKEKPQLDGKSGTITIKSNPILARWVTHKLENNNTKEVLSLLWRF